MMAVSPFNTERLEGLDLARAIALIGMFAAHIGSKTTSESETLGWPWLAIADGRSSALFVVLAGVSVTLMTWPNPIHGQTKPRYSRLRFVIRALLIFALGLLLEIPDTMIDVILTNMAVILLLTMFFQRARIRTLGAVGTLCLVVGGWLSFTLRTKQELDPDTLALGNLWDYHYPAIAWLGYALIGMLIGRILLLRRATLRYSYLPFATLSSLGAALVISGTGTLLRRPNHEYPFAFHWDSLRPHSYSPLEMMSNTAVACAIIFGSAWLLRSTRVRRWSRALLSFGSMPLSMYTAHLAIIAVVGVEMVLEPSNVAFVVTTTALIVFAWLWRSVFRRGPLEWVIAQLSRVMELGILKALKRAQ